MDIVGLYTEIDQMIPYDFQVPPKRDVSWKGICALARDWIDTPTLDTRIVPVWHLDLLCGFSLLGLPLVAALF